MANILAETDLAEERRRKYRSEEELATKEHLQKLHNHAADITNGVLGMWDRISDKSIDITNVSNLFHFRNLTNHLSRI